MEPVAFGVQQPNFLQTLSGLLSVKQQQQALAGGAADVQMRQQDARQRHALANVDWDKHMSDDGTLDLNSFMKDQDMRKAAGDAYPQLIEQASHIKSAQLDAKSRLLGLNKDQLSAYASMLGGLRTDEDVQAGNEAGRAKAKAAFTEFAQTYGMDAAKAVAPVALPLMNDQLPPDKLGKMIEHVQMQAQDTARQLELQRPSGPQVQRPGGLQMVNENAYAPGGIGPTGPTVSQGIAPTVVTTPTGQVGKVENNATTITPLSSPQAGGGLPQRAPGQLPAIPRPDANAPKWQQEQYQAQNETSVKHTQAVMDSYADPLNNPQATRYRNSEILRLTDTAPTGPGKEIWNHVASQFPGTSGDPYQKIGHYLAQNTIANLNSMGVPNTNAGADVSAAATGNVSQNPGAIKEITKVNDAVNTAREQYARGLQKITENQSNFDRVPAYRQAFGQAFDINLFRLEDAERRKDFAEIADITKKVGKDGLKQLYQKKRVLDSLTSNGTLPNE